MPAAHVSINSANRITPPAAGCFPETLTPAANAIRLPTPTSAAIPAPIVTASGRSPGASGSSAARTAALRSSERFGVGLLAGAGSLRRLETVGAPGPFPRRPRLRLRCPNVGLAAIVLARDRRAELVRYGPR